MDDSSSVSSVTTTMNDVKLSSSITSKEKQQQQRPPKDKQQQQQQQQQQRAPKEKQQQQQHQQQQKQQQQKVPKEQQQQNDNTRKVVEALPSTSQPLANRLAFFDHLVRKPINASLYSDVELHTATIELGLLYKNGYIHEDDDRCSALIVTFCKIIQDYNAPYDKNLSRDLDKHISKQFDYLVHCRQHSIGMGNIIKFLRFVISNVNPELSESAAKESIINSLLTFFEERITFARKSIATYFTSALRDGDVILTFGSSPLIRYILQVASTTKQFRLIVVDTRPLNEGLKTLSSLSSTVRCIYTPLSGAAAAMRNATRVILGASALFSNGAVLAPAGTAMVAALAKAQRVPVIFAAESYKFSEKVQLDSIVFNELGNTNELLDKKVINDEVESAPKVSASAPTATASVAAPMQIYSLRYDLTPISNISVVATETGLIPPTSIPVLIRELKDTNGSNTTRS